MKFAVTRTGRPSANTLSRLMGGTHTSDWSSLEATAQAGMILGVVSGVGPLGKALLIAGSASRKMRCECRRTCCSGWALNLEWIQAINFIASAAHTRLKTRQQDVFAVSALVAKFYGKSASIPQVAATFGIDIEVLVRYHRALHKWLMGEDGVDVEAWRGAESLLRDAGIVGEE